MPRGAYAGVVYWLCFSMLIFFAVRNDLAVNQANQQSASKPPIHKQSSEGDYGTGATAGEQHATPKPQPPVPTAPPEPLHAASQQHPQSGHQEGKESWGERLQTDPVATFTAALALFTLVLAGVAIWQGIHLQRSVEVARASAEALPTMERAYLFLMPDDITFTVVEFKRPYPILPEEPEIDRQIKVRFSFTNYGRTPAIITAIGYDLKYLRGDVNESVNGWPEIPNIRFEDGLKIFPISPGRKSTHFEWAYSVNHERWTAAEIADGHIIFWGAVLYDDVFGKNWRTSFGWLYDWLEGRFVIAPDDELYRRT